MSREKDRARAAQAAARRRKELAKAERDEQDRRSRARLRTTAGRRAARRAARAAEPPHVRRRRRLLFWTWLPAAVLLFFGVHMLVLLPVYGQGRAAWDAGDDGAAMEVFDRQRSAVPVEQWKADFNAGTARARAGLWSSALDALDQALVGVPDEHRCAVQTNRATVLEAYTTEMEAAADDALAEAVAVGVALVARAAGEPYDEEVLEPPYEGADPPVYSEELRWAHYLLEEAADHAALRAEALADPACPTPPSSGAGGGGGGGGDEEREQEQQAAQEQLAELSERAQNVGRAMNAGEIGPTPGAPAPDEGADADAPTGADQAPAPQDAEAERQAQVAERNQQANGGGAGADDATGGGAGPDDGTGGDGAPDGPSGGTSGGGAPGTGRDPGAGGGAPGGRNW
ncbi:hypothetical protein [Cellulomonas shaoxiangyii]|uniref:Uncharacterized protein n=1 Tax=Cellulomonas shaoxiangyii TaxID=2566013 RepID=A0A4P7SF62_9CELL|nr:hypothetical protein [Cellulomonas shaoxiangyii]QCB92510.1 hypothetical protein E5225_02005 [Cellulomonas shaoxiangyii]TGY83399.1 hypothetical protein E5226_12255 [Cellulomonas shaoxiangyii]